MWSTPLKMDKNDSTWLAITANKRFTREQVNILSVHRIRHLIRHDYFINKFHHWNCCSANCFITYLMFNNIPTRMISETQQAKKIVTIFIQTIYICPWFTLRWRMKKKKKQMNRISWLIAKVFDIEIGSGRLSQLLIELNSMMPRKCRFPSGYNLGHLKCFCCFFPDQKYDCTQCECIFCSHTGRVMTSWRVFTQI